MGSRHSLPIATSPSDRRAMRLACPGSLRSQHLSFTLPSAVLTLQVCWQTDDPRLVDPTGGGKLAAGLVPRRRRALDCSGSYGCPSIAPCGRGHCEKEERESCQPNASLKKKKKKARGRQTHDGDAGNWPCADVCAARNLSARSFSRTFSPRERCCRDSGG